MINPGLLKLELFCKGIRLNKVPGQFADCRPVLRTRGGLGSGLEMILPQGLYVNVPTEENFVAKSPYSLALIQGKYFIMKNGETLCEVKLPVRPKFYDTKTSSGKTMSRIGIMQGTYLGIYPTRVCEFWKMSPRMNCKFCSVGLNVGQTEEYEKGVEDVLETVLAAIREENITFVHFNTGYLGGEELEVLVPYIKAVKKNTGLLVGVQSPPAADFSEYRLLKKIGVDHVSFCLELFDAGKFTEVCPGKNKYLGQRKYFEAIDYCVKLFGKGKVAGEVIAGLEDTNCTIKAIEYFAARGVVSNVCVFRPCKGTDLEGSNPPLPEEIIPVFRRMYEVCFENDIPINIAPNIKVSIIILPEEGRYFLDGKSVHLPGRFKLGLLRVIFRTFFSLRVSIINFLRKICP